MATSLRDDGRYPTRAVLEIIGDKWTPIVIYRLSEGTLRFGDLKRQIPGISNKVLAQSLRHLDELGLVTREVFPEIPPRTQYTLTATGRQLYEPIAALCRWAEANESLLNQILKKRRRR